MAVDPVQPAPPIVLAAPVGEEHLQRTGDPANFQHIEPQGIVGDNIVLENGDPGTVLDLPNGPDLAGFFQGPHVANDNLPRDDGADRVAAAVAGHKLSLELQKSGAGWMDSLTPEEHGLLAEIVDDLMSLAMNTDGAGTAAEWDQVYAQMALIKSVEFHQVKRDLLHAAGKLLLPPSVVQLADQIRAAAPAALSLAAILL